MSRNNIEAPWDHVPPAAPGRGVPNLPTSEGRELGEGLARMTDQVFVAHPELPERCGDCAFRADTNPNGSPVTLMTALKCVMEGESFMCHVDEGRVCRGWAAARRGWLKGARKHGG